MIAYTTSREEVGKAVPSFSRGSLFVVAFNARANGPSDLNASLFVFVAASCASIHPSMPRGETSLRPWCPCGYLASVSRGMWAKFVSPVACPNTVNLSRPAFFFVLFFFSLLSSLLCSRTPHGDDLSAYLYSKPALGVLRSEGFYRIIIKKHLAALRILCTY